MILEVDTASAVPPFEQVRGQLSALILSGTLPPGHRLPPIRQLAADLGLAPGTVARVYKELEADALVTSRVRHGTVVADMVRPSGETVRRQKEEAVRSFVLAMRRIGLDREDAVAAVRAGWSEA